MTWGMEVQRNRDWKLDIGIAQKEKKEKKEKGSPVDSPSLGGLFS